MTVCSLKCGQYSQYPDLLNTASIYPHLLNTASIYPYLLNTASIYPYLLNDVLIVLKGLCHQHFAHFCHNCTCSILTNYSFSCTKHPGYHTNSKISSEFSKGGRTITSFKLFFQYNLKKLAQLFQVAIHFHPDHLQLKTATDSLYTNVVIFNKTGLLFLGFH